jgi:hypothetical protein
MSNESLEYRTQKALERVVRALSWIPHNREAREALGIKEGSQDWAVAETQTDLHTAVSKECQQLSMEWKQKG